MLYRKTKSTYLQSVESAYLSVRTKEGRVYTDDQVLLVQELSKSHPQHKEWMIRKDSLKKIINVLKDNPKVNRILDLGCGNGWMSNSLNKAGYEVVGLDINRLELEQAARLFTNCTFFEGDVFDDVTDLQFFDAIIISAALQYFKDPILLIEHLKKNLLNQNGFIVIADTKFYKMQDVKSAQLRTQTYYQQMQISEMTSHYFHHQIDILNQLNASVIKSKSIFAEVRDRLKGIKNPFKLYKISKN
jgi:SAM-dependent methyltransferase